MNAVQTLSRLNRTHPEKKGTMVLDFANECRRDQGRLRALLRDDAALARRPTRTCSTRSERGLLDFRCLQRERRRELRRGLLRQERNAGPALQPSLAPVVERFEALSGQRSSTTSAASSPTTCGSTRSWPRCSPSPTPTSRSSTSSRGYLRRLLPVRPGGAAARRVQQNIDMESYRIQQTGSGKIALERGNGRARPVSDQATATA